MSRFIEIRVNRLQAVVMSDFVKLENQFNEIINQYERGGLAAKIAYKRANDLKARFHVLCARLRNIVAAANNFDSCADHSINKGFAAQFCIIQDKLNYFGL